MSSTVRVYVNNKRVATAKPWGTAFLQVHPEQKTFASEGDWRSYVYQHLMSSIRFESGPDSEVEDTAPATNTVVQTVARVSQKPKTERFDKKDWIRSKDRKATLPPGKYYIGDLCYALDDYLYENVFGPSYDDGKFVSTKDSKQVFMMGGTGGDGEFQGTDGKKYAVDAGIIGIASESTLDPKKAPYSGGSLYTFKSDVTVKLREDKFIFYGADYNDPSLTIYIYEEDYEDSE